MGSIRTRKRKDGTTAYRADVRLKGSPPQRATFNRLTDAKKWIKITESNILEGRHFKTLESKKHTLGEVVERYIREVLPQKSKNINQKSQLEWWAEQIGYLTLADVTPSAISHCRDKLLVELKFKPATVRRYMAALSHAYTVAINDWGWAEENPIRKVSKPKLPQPRVRFLSDMERAALLEACQDSESEYLYTVVVLAISTGMRKAEIMGLRWEDVDLETGKATLFNTKNGEIRAVPLQGHALDLVRALREQADSESDLLFPSRKRADRSIDLRAPWESALRKAKIEDFKFHDLRHTAASYLAMNGASLAEIADILGHKTFQMVKRYAHLSEAHTTAVVASMNEKMFG